MQLYLIYKTNNKSETEYSSQRVRLPIAVDGDPKTFQTQEITLAEFETNNEHKWNGICFQYIGEGSSGFQLKNLRIEYAE